MWLFLIVDSTSKEENLYTYLREAMLNTSETNIPKQNQTSQAYEKTMIFQKKEIKNHL